MAKGPKNWGARNRQRRRTGDQQRAAEAAGAAAPREPPPGAPRLIDCEFSNNGVGIKAEGGAIVGDRLKFRGNRTAIEAEGTELYLNDVDIV